MLLRLRDLHTNQQLPESDPGATDYVNDDSTADDDHVTRSVTTCSLAHTCPVKSA